MIWHRCITTLILDQDGCAWIYIYKRSPLVKISVCTTYLHHTTQGCILTSFYMLSKYIQFSKYQMGSVSWFLRLFWCVSPQNSTNQIVHCMRSHWNNDAGRHNRGITIYKPNKRCPEICQIIKQDSLEPMVFGQVEQ